MAKVSLQSQISAVTQALDIDGMTRAQKRLLRTQIAAAVETLRFIRAHEQAFRRLLQESGSGGRS